MTAILARRALPGRQPILARVAAAWSERKTARRDRLATRAATRRQRRLDKKQQHRARHAIRKSRRMQRRHRWWANTSPYLLAVACLASFVVVGFMWCPIAGVAVLGVAFGVLEWRIHGR